MEYSNENKGALFTPKSENLPCDLSGMADINGVNFYADYCKSNGRSRGVLILKGELNQYAVLLRPSTKGKAIMFGSVSIDGVDWMVSVFQNEPKSERSPKLSLTFFQKTGVAEVKVEEDSPF